MSLLKSQFGNQLRKIRKSRGFSQERFAELIEISPRNLSKIETGLSFPSTASLEKIFSCLNCKPGELFDFEIRNKSKSFKQDLSDKVNLMDEAEAELVLKLLSLIEQYRK